MIVFGNDKYKTCTHVYIYQSYNRHASNNASQYSYAKVYKLSLKSIYTNYAQSREYSPLFRSTVLLSNLSPLLKRTVLLYNFSPVLKRTVLPYNA